MEGRVGLSALLAAVVAGCFPFSSGAGCPKDPPLDSDEAHFTPTEEDLAAALDENGELTEEGCAVLCEVYVQVDPSTITDCGWSDSDPVAGEASLSCTYEFEQPCLGGRAHASIRSVADGRGREVVGAWLAASAHMEAASVKAFAVIAVELARFGAPSDLVDRAEAALRDEVRHARMLGSLATRRGARMVPPTFGDPGERDLVAFAVENAVEGCVRETWAALLAHWQGVHAQDPEIAAAYARIAIDESRHAELAADIDQWLQGRLSPRERAAVETARRAAVAALWDVTEPDPDLQRIAGLPSAATARRLLRGLTTGLWDSSARAA